MRYSIGDVSRVLGMTTSALHFYEKEGVIDTPKEQSGRRYYEDADVMRLISAKKYRAMGVPLREIAAQFSSDGMTGRQVLDRMREQRAEAARLSAQYAALAQDIARLIDLSEPIERGNGVVDICAVGPMLMFRGEGGGIVPRDKAGQALAQRWLEAMPAVSLGIVKRTEDERAGFSLLIPQERAGDYGFEPNGKTMQILSGGMALHAVVHCGEEQYERPETIFGPILSFARAHRFTPCGAIWGSMLLVDCSGGARKHYYDTYMPFL
ncbi:MAG: MerR family transcriptional regulator [Clostridiales bacterium]|nr:MerR family transcriptional regulator [Clostridiales bacterium]